MWEIISELLLHFGESVGSAVFSYCPVSEHSNSTLQGLGLLLLQEEDDVLLIAEFSSAGVLECS
jgi:hypothetical protein